MPESPKGGRLTSDHREIDPRKGALREVALQILVLALAQAVLSFAGILGERWRYSALALSVSALLGLLLLRARPALADRAFVLAVGATCLSVPWTEGGIYNPILFLALAWIQSATFLLGLRWGAAATILTFFDLVFLHVAARLGWLQVHPVSPLIVVLYVSMLVVHVAMFVSSPLKVVRYLTAAAADIISRRRCESHLRALNSGLEDEVADRKRSLEAVRERLHLSVEDLASEFRGLIEHLRVDAQAISDLTGEDEEQEWASWRLLLACQRMARIQEVFLRFCRVSESSLDIQELSSGEHEAIVLEAWAEVRHAHPDRIFTFLLEPLMAVRADRDLLRQVWQNLLSNAAKYTSRQNLSWIRVGCSGRWFLVEDNGVGFDMAWVERLFGVFQRLHSEGEFPGEGIGLATVRRIVERHGGAISAEGKPGLGATFRFRMAALAKGEESATDG